MFWGFFIGWMPKISKLNLITLPSSPKPNSVAMEIEKPEHPKGPWAKLQHKVGPVSKLQLIWFPYEAFPSGMTLPNRWLRGPALSRIPISALHLTLSHTASLMLFLRLLKSWTERVFQANGSKQFTLPCFITPSFVAWRILDKWVRPLSFRLKSCVIPRWKIESAQTHERCARDRVPVLKCNTLWQKIRYITLFITVWRDEKSHWCHVSKAAAWGCDQLRGKGASRQRQMPQQPRNCQVTCLLTFT